MHRQNDNGDLPQPTGLRHFYCNYIFTLLPKLNFYSQSLHT